MLGIGSTAAIAEEEDSLVVLEGFGGKFGQREEGGFTSGCGVFEDFGVGGNGLFK